MPDTCLKNWVKAAICFAFQGLHDQLILLITIVSSDDVGTSGMEPAVVLSEYQGCIGVIHGLTD